MIPLYPYFCVSSAYKQNRNLILFTIARKGEAYIVIATGPKIVNTAVLKVNCTLRILLVLKVKYKLRVLLVLKVNCTLRILLVLEVKYKLRILLVLKVNCTLRILLVLKVKYAL